MVRQVSRAQLLGLAPEMIRHIPGEAVNLRFDAARGPPFSTRYGSMLR
jgi:hypothetical protein